MLARSGPYPVVGVGVILLLSNRRDGDTATSISATHEIRWPHTHWRN